MKEAAELTLPNKPWQQVVHETEKKKTAYGASILSLYSAGFEIRNFRCGYEGVFVPLVREERGTQL